MRRLLYSDVDCAARTLMAVPNSDRPAEVEQMFTRAHSADKYRKRFGKAVEGSGDGRLAAACYGQKKADGGRLSDPEYRRCFAIILNYMNEK